MKISKMTIAAAMMPLLVACTTTLPLDGALKSARSQIIGETTQNGLDGDISFHTPKGLSCAGKLKYQSDFHQSFRYKAAGTLQCSDGRTGSTSIDMNKPFQAGSGLGVLSDGEELIFSIGGDIVPGAYMQYMTPRREPTAGAQKESPQVVVPQAEVVPYQYVGETKVEGLIIDPAGVSPEKYNSDVSACRKLRGQVEGSVIGDAIGGALVGSAIAKLAGDEYSRTKAAQVGAGAAVIDGAVDSDNEKEKVLRNCLIGRGYRVLN